MNKYIFTRSKKRANGELRSHDWVVEGTLEQLEILAKYESKYRPYDDATFKIANDSDVTTHFFDKNGKLWCKCGTPTVAEMKKNQ